MGCSVGHYWEQYRSELVQMSVEVDHAPGTEAYVAELPGGLRGTVDARLWFDNTACLYIFEHIEIDDGVVHRTKYSYHLEVDGVVVERWDKDPNRGEDLVYHVNRPDGGGVNQHIPDRRRTLKEVVEMCWSLIQDVREATGEPGDQLEFL